jgi:hypothetical protein
MTDRPRTRKTTLAALIAGSIGLLSGCVTTQTAPVTPPPIQTNPPPAPPATQANPAPPSPAPQPAPAVPQPQPQPAIAPPLGEGNDLYGGYDLQRGDYDFNLGASTSNGILPCTQQRWGGVTRNCAPAQVQSQLGCLLTCGVLQHVRQLQEDLRELGFLIVDAPEGVAVFDMHTEWAVKEFQIYASMTHVARMAMVGEATRLEEIIGEQNQRPSMHPADIAARGMVPAGTDLHGSTTEHPVSYYVASLEQVVNQGRYAGPISGVVNARTRASIRYWKEHNYRCPVVVEAWRTHGNNEDATRTTLDNGGVNIWHYNDGISSGRAFFRDFTKYYTYPNGRDENEYHVLGGNYNSNINIRVAMRPLIYGNPVTWRGPTTAYNRHTWPQAEMTPDRLTGNQVNTIVNLALPDNINSAITSTYRVVRAASEQENQGDFDAVNCNDDAIASLGSCHWTFGLQPVLIDNNTSTRYSDGELSSFFAYLFNHNRDAYIRAVGNFGLWSNRDWTTMHPNNAANYHGWFRKDNEPYRTRTEIADNIANLPLIDRTVNECLYYRIWHWHYRWVMAGRTIPGFQQAMWPMTRIRIRDILNRRISLTNTAVAITNVRLGDIYTSERSVAILLRWHIYRPAHVTSAPRVGNYVLLGNGLPSNATQEQINAATPTGEAWKAVGDAIQDTQYNNANHINWTLPINQWEDAHEIALYNNLYRYAQTRNNAMQSVHDWPNQNNGHLVHAQFGRLRTSRNSFVFDTTGL